MFKWTFDTRRLGLPSVMNKKKMKEFSFQVVLSCPLWNGPSCNKTLRTTCHSVLCNITVHDDMRMWTCNPLRYVSVEVEKRWAARISLEEYEIYLHQKDLEFKLDFWTLFLYLKTWEFWIDWYMGLKKLERILNQNRSKHFWLSVILNYCDPA